METSIFFASSSSFFCSYRTYEEWKLYHAITFLSVLRTRSYRTYEEWKLVVGHKIAISKRVLTVPMRNGNPFSLLLCHGRLRSYRTYEEWKLLTIPLALRLDKFVLTVPMRNGNIVSHTLSNVVVIVLTVPMRNGNEINVSASARF